MFEKEAEEWVENNLHSTEEDYIKAFKDGAEFGYNKAKEEMRGKHNVDWRKIKKTTKGIEQDNSEEIKYRNSNLNYYIKIKLTEEGRIIYKKYYAKYNCEAPKLNIDNEGYVRFQIHEFMNIFGEHLFMGATLPCETNCKIQIKEEQMGCRNACICGGRCSESCYEAERYCGEAEDIYDELYGKSKEEEEYYKAMEEQEKE